MSQGWKAELIFAGTVAKRDGEQNEDRFRVDEATLCFVLSDGASVSYDPATWAELLCTKFMENPAVDAGWVSEAVASYNRTVDREALSWMKQAAFDRGSFASLLGVQLNLDFSTIEIRAIGDTNIFILENGALTDSFPVRDVEQFSNSPDLICTVASENAYLTTDVLTESYMTVDLSERLDAGILSILMATDALSAWAMADPTNERLIGLFSVTDENQLKELVSTERANGSLKVDDTTLITIRISRGVSPEH
jgi:hypothetical protein